MQRIKIEKDNKIIGLLLRPETGDPVSIDNIKKIIPHIKILCNQEENKFFDDMVIQNGLIKSKYINKEILNNIVYNCTNKLSEKIIVSQSMGQGPDIRHRPLYFGSNLSDNTIEIKFTTLGDFNSIDKAVTMLAY